MNMDLYRLADDHVVSEYEKQRGVLAVLESGLSLAAEVLRCHAAGEPVPDLPRPLPRPDAPTVEWLDWCIVSGGLRLAVPSPALFPQAERLFDPSAVAA